MSLLQLKEGCEVTTLRVADRLNYVQLDSRAVNDKTLSFRARGIHAWLLEKADGWTVNANGIALNGKEGRDAVRAALNELEAAGYLVRRKWRGDDGQWHSESWVYEHPSVVDKPVDKDANQDGFPDRVNRTGNSGPLTKKKTNNNLPDDSAPKGASPGKTDPARCGNHFCDGSGWHETDDGTVVRCAS